MDEAKGRGCRWFFFFKQKTAYEMLRSLVGSEMCIRDSVCSGHASFCAGQDFGGAHFGEFDDGWHQYGGSHLSLIHI